MSQDSTEGLLSYRQAGTLLGVSPRTVERWVQDGEIPFIRIGRTVRFKPSDITEFIEAHRVEGATSPDWRRNVEHAARSRAVRAAAAEIEPGEEEPF